MNQPRLIVVMGGIVGHEYLLMGDNITIGRGQDNTIFTADLRVSTHHARILAHIGLFWLEDLNSTNGTFLSPPRGERFRLKPHEPVLLVEEALIHLADAVTLQARGLVASQDEATRQTLTQVQTFVSDCYEQIVRLPSHERQEIQARVRQLEQAIRSVTSEAELVRIVAEGLSDLTRTVACKPETVLPSIDNNLPEPNSPHRLPSVHNLFISQFQQLSDRIKENK